MTYEMYRYVFLGAAIACGVLFIVSAILFFALHIPKIISDLTGRTARKAIEEIRVQSEQSDANRIAPGLAHLEKRKLTDIFSQSGRLIFRNTGSLGVGAARDKSASSQLPAKEPVGETSVLSEAEIKEDGGKTTLLSEAGQHSQQEFVVEYEITFIHSNEVIGEETQ